MIASLQPQCEDAVAAALHFNGRRRRRLYCSVVITNYYNGVIEKQDYYHLRCNSVLPVFNN